MLQKEFEERTGMKVGGAYYEEVVQTSYFDSPLEKDDFCREWAKNHKGITQAAMAVISDEVASLVCDYRRSEKTSQDNWEAHVELSNQNEEMRKQLEEARKLTLEAQEQTARLYERLYGICAETEDKELREMCIEHFGWKGYLRKKLANGHELLQDEREELMEMLD